MRTRGNVQKVAADLNIAYNTARNRLDDIVAALDARQPANAGQPRAGTCAAYRVLRRFLGVKSNSTRPCASWNTRGRARLSCRRRWRVLLHAIWHFKKLVAAILCCPARTFHVRPLSDARWLR